MEAFPTLASREDVGLSRVLAAQPDRVLCALAKRGHASAYDVLHERYRGRLFAFVFHMLGSTGTISDAEDITQDSFAKAFRSLATRRPDGSFRAWLFAIARNHTFDHLRVPRPHVTDITELDLRDHDATDDDAERREELSWLLTTVDALPRRQREALVMRELAGMSYADVAVAMESSEASIKQLIARARSAISESAEASGHRPRRLDRELTLVAPLPLALGAGGAGSALVGGASAATAGVVSAGAAAGSGGTLFGGLAAGKLCAVVCTAAAIGGGVVTTGVVGDDGRDQTASGGSPGTIGGHFVNGGDSREIVAYLPGGAGPSVSGPGFVPTRGKPARRPAGSMGTIPSRVRSPFAPVNARTQAATGKSNPKGSAENGGEVGDSPSGRDGSGKEKSGSNDQAGAKVNAKDQNVDNGKEVAADGKGKADGQAKDEGQNNGKAEATDKGQSQGSGKDKGKGSGGGKGDGSGQGQGNAKGKGDGQVQDKANGKDGGQGQGKGSGGKGQGKDTGQGQTNAKNDGSGKRGDGQKNSGGNGSSGGKPKGDRQGGSGSKGGRGGDRQSGGREKSGSRQSVSRGGRR